MRNPRIRNVESQADLIPHSAFQPFPIGDYGFRRQYHTDTRMSYSACVPAAIPKPR